MHPDPNTAVLDFLATRRSVTAKTLAAPGPDRAALADLLTLASRVPDHGKIVPWRFAVIMPEAQPRIREAALARLAEMGQDPSAIEKARVVFSHQVPIVAVISSPGPAGKVPLWEQEMAAGCVCLSLVNAALAAGWGANWLSGPLTRDEAFLTGTLGCREGEWVPGYIHIGTAQIAPADRDRPRVEDLTTWL
ncbi:nitroreductase family protein [Rhodobacteraceae bacterium NNCM2]|nr:nitroreductase family protein [Coraliihabitans acroporae]